MRIYGVDFTSAPSRAKPITVAECDFEAGHLVVRDLLRIPDFPAFEQGLQRPGPWVAGMDFPFSQPRRLVAHLGWPLEWEAMVDRVAALTKEEWADLLDLYRASQPAGDKEHKRRTDRVARALPAMKLYGTPVAKMFFEGAPRLRRTGLHLPVLRPTDDPRTVLEAYPGLAARNLVGPRRSYKAETKRRQTAARRKVRRELVAALQGEAVRRVYGFPVRLHPHLAASLVEDGKGDRLDAVLCAVQAAWAWRAVGDGGTGGGAWGIPPGCDRLEGWIVDPATANPPGRP